MWDDRVYVAKSLTPVAMARTLAPPGILAH